MVRVHQGSSLFLTDLLDLSFFLSLYYICFLKPGGSAMVSALEMTTSPHPSSYAYEEEYPYALLDRIDQAADQSLVYLEAWTTTTLRTVRGCFCFPPPPIDLEARTPPPTPPPSPDIIIVIHPNKETQPTPTILARPVAEASRKVFDFDPYA